MTGLGCARHFRRTPPTGSVEEAVGQKPRKTISCQAQNGHKPTFGNFGASCLLDDYRSIVCVQISLTDVIIIKR